MDACRDYGPLVWATPEVYVVTRAARETQVHFRGQLIDNAFTEL